ncbi:DUF4190 domain-containing protein [Cellulomonas chengniuliangii]|uniref:DUF4190 domain-containing protein n=1 Tax=Cellulomonas chengniuliangii TaxID=2968084 RepID=A0ABY5L1A5_9CELL|nr:DUF4190 domain-containing protein [Cellulomonas chengniuliangii]MCC2307782.1 DUF4190 domain-containing protein [Cellulomonas chengniuliangii]UUI75461.1 DUF4190 domain-containing protein [Cellulomonas chengniuliangii]
MSDSQATTDPTTPGPVPPEAGPDQGDDAQAAGREDATPDATPDADEMAGPPPAPAPIGTDGLAIAGLIVAFVAWPVGLALSIAALVRVRRTGQAGKGLAIGGIAVSALAFATTVAVAIVFVVAGAAIVRAEDAVVAVEATDLDEAEAGAAAPGAVEPESAPSEAPVEAAAPVVEGGLALPAAVAGLSGVPRGCEILFGDDPHSLLGVVTGAGEGDVPETILDTVQQLGTAAKADLGAEHVADVDALLAIFAPETYELAQEEMTAKYAEGDAAGNRLAVVCGFGLS